MVNVVQEPHVAKELSSVQSSLLSSIVRRSSFPTAVFPASVGARLRALRLGGGRRGPGAGAPKSRLDGWTPRWIPLQLHMILFLHV